MQINLSQFSKIQSKTWLCMEWHQQAIVRNSLFSWNVKKKKEETLFNKMQFSNTRHYFQPAILENWEYETLFDCIGWQNITTFLKIFYKIFLKEYLILLLLVVRWWYFHPEKCFTKLKGTWFSYISKQRKKRN